MRWRLLLRWLRLLALAFVLFAGYRMLFVYEFDPGRCGGPRLAGARAISASRVKRLPPAAAGPATTARSLTAGRAAGPRLRVLSYNIQGHAAIMDTGHLAAVAEVINRWQPDVVGLQEVHRGTWQARFRDQSAELARRTGLELSFGPSFRALGGEFGNAVLSRGHIVESEVFSLPTFGEPRTLLRARVELDGFAFELFVTHLAAWGRINRRVRTAQTHCLAAALQGSAHPRLLLGDLNAVPQSPELAALRASEAPLILCGEATAVTHPLLRRRLDYIFAGPGWRVRSGRVLEEGPSDHWPVLAELEWTGS